MYASSRLKQIHRFQKPLPRSGFTLIEILVVISIIVILLGILLVALSSARNRAYAAQTTAVMDSFAQSCEKFRQDHGFLPGVVPEAILAGSPQISGTENALLHLMGGYVVEDEIGANAYNAYSTDDGWREVSFDDNSDDGNYKMKFNLQRIGEGPTIKGRKFSPYFSPSEREMLDIEMNGSEQYSPGFGGSEVLLPDLVDGWGRPILYFRQTRTRGDLTNSDLTARPQFYLETALPYLLSENIDSNDQSFANWNGGSILSNDDALSSGDEARHAALAQILRQPAIGSPINNNDLLKIEEWNSISRGSIVLISAGPDGIYFAATDGPGSIETPIGGNDYPVEDFIGAGTGVLEKFDDVVYCGG